MKRAASCPCLALLPAGVTWPPALLRTPVVSYTTFSPSPSSLPLPPPPSLSGEGSEVRVGGRRSVSVALIRQVAPSRGFPGAVPYGVRTFLDPGLALRTATARPA